MSHIQPSPTLVVNRTVRFFACLLLIASARTAGAQRAPWIEAGLGHGRIACKATVYCPALAVARAAAGIHLTSLVAVGLALDGGSDLDFIDGPSHRYRAWSGFVELMPPPKPALRLRVGAGVASGRTRRESGQGLVGRAGVTFQLPPYSRLGLQFSADYMAAATGRYRGATATANTSRFFDLRVLHLGVALRVGSARPKPID